MSTPPDYLPLVTWGRRELCARACSVIVAVAEGHRCAARVCELFHNRKTQARALVTTAAAPESIKCSPGDLLAHPGAFVQHFQSDFMPFSGEGHVNSGQSTLEALENAGLAVQASCRRGTCGTCEVAVLEGVPEHLDSVMSDADKDELGVMYPCVSRSKTPSLSLKV